MSMNTLSRCQPLLGTFVEVTLSAPISDAELLSLSGDAFAEISRVQRALSFHEPSSELSMFNRWALSGSGDVFKISHDLRAVLELTVELSTLSHGRYDVCVAPALVADNLLPNHLALENAALGCARDLLLTDDGVFVRAPLCVDLGGVAKGYAVDRAFSVLPDDVEVVINAGGDMRMSHWRSELVNLRFGRSNRAQRRAEMMASAVASSGHYYRRAIVDPTTGRSRNRGGSVSVFAHSAMVADALTKIVWLLPKEQAESVLRRYNAPAISISRFGVKTFINQ